MRAANISQSRLCPGRIAVQSVPPPLERITAHTLEPDAALERAFTGNEWVRPSVVGHHWQICGPALKRYEQQPHA